MNERAALAVIGLLVCAVVVLAYLEWWRAGELEDLADRLRKLETKPRPVAKSKPATSGNAGTGS